MGNSHVGCMDKQRSKLCWQNETFLNSNFISSTYVATQSIMNIWALRRRSREEERKRERTRREKKKKKANCHFSPLYYRNCDPQSSQDSYVNSLKFLQHCILKVSASCSSSLCFLKFQEFSIVNT